MDEKKINKILGENKEVFDILEEYDKTGKPISRIIEEKVSN